MDGINYGMAQYRESNSGNLNASATIDKIMSGPYIDEYNRGNPLPKNTADKLRSNRAIPGLAETIIKYFNLNEVAPMFSQVLQDTENKALDRSATRDKPDSAKRHAAAIAKILEAEKAGKPELFGRGMTMATGWHKAAAHEDGSDVVPGSRGWDAAAAAEGGPFRSIHEIARATRIAAGLTHFTDAEGHDGDDKPPQTGRGR